MTTPNILLIVSDDHGYADMSHLGVREDVRTPGLDRLAAQGTRFTDAYATAPICSPSRVAIMTGRYQQQWGGLWFGSSQFPPDTSVPTLAEMLSEQGYRTGYFGKVHYGGEQVGDRACPPHHGFGTTLYGLAGQTMGRLNYLHHTRQAVEDYGEAGAQTMAVQPLLSGDDEVETDTFLTDILGGAARDFIAAEDDSPFFCMLAFNAVHNFCWQLPAEELARRGLPSYDDWTPDSGVSYGEWYDDVIVPNLPYGREYYLAQLELMDAQISLILDQLDDLGIAENTIVVYITDNGGSTCNFASNEPLRGTKYTLWEGGIRIPMIWSWPGTIPAGITRSVPVSTLDLMASFRDIVGAPDDPRLDGATLLPTLMTPPSASTPSAPSGAADHVADRALHWDCGFQFAIREGDWKLSWVSPTDEQTQQLVRWEHAPMGSGWHLTNLREDLSEQHDLSDAHPERVESLLSRHRGWRESMGLSHLPS